MSLLRKEPVLDLPGSWPMKDLKALLKILDLDLDVISDLQEVEEMCHMALAELPPPEAAELVLNYLLGEDLSAGQISNMSHDMLDEKMWEEFPEIALHEKIYLANYLLYKAFNGKFPRPSAEKVVLQVQSSMDDQILEKLHQQDRQLYLKILLPAFEENALVHRLYEEQIKSGNLAEPALFIWSSELINEAGKQCIAIIASTYWFDDLLDHASYEIELSEYGMTA